MRHILLVFSLLACISSVPIAAHASATASIDITVVSGLTTRPIALARLLISGSGQAIVYTDAAGHAHLDGLPPGTYSVSIYAPGYRERRDTFTIADGDASTLSAVLAPVTSPKVIASVKVTAHTSNDPNGASASSALATLDGGLGGAIRHLPDTAVIAGNLLLQGLSLGAYSTNVDGFAMSGGGRNSLLSGVGLDLFDSVHTRGPGSPNGAGVDLSIGEPTIAFQSSATQRLDEYGSGATSASLKGSAGYVGFVLKYSNLSVQGPLQGLDFLDATGTRYSHDDNTTGRGGVLKVRIPTNISNSILFDATSIAGEQRQACNTDSGGTPCSYGKGVYTTNQLAGFGVRDTLVSGRTDLSAAFSSSESNFAFNAASRDLNGASTPLSSQAVTSTKAIMLHADGESAGNALSLDLSSLSSSSTTQSVLFLAAVQAQRFSNLQLADAFALSAATQADVQLGYARGTSPHMSATWRQQSRLPGGDQLRFRLNVGEASPDASQDIPTAGALDDPPSVQYDCFHGRAFAELPGDDPNDPTDTGLGLDYRHERGNTIVVASLSQDVVHNAYIPTLEPASYYGPSAITATQLAGIQTFYQSAAACGTPTALTASDIVLSRMRNGTLASGRLTLSMARRFSSRFTLAPYVQIARSVVRYDGTWRPALYVPAYRFGILFDAHVGTMEALAFVDHQGANNANGIGAFTTLDIGFSEPLARGTITLSATNALNTRAPLFRSSAFADVLANGVLPIATPLDRSTVHLSYAVRIGASPPPSTLDALQALAAAIQPANDAFVVRYTVMQPGIAEHPFLPDTNSEDCTPELVNRAASGLAWLRDADSRLSLLAKPDAIELVNDSLGLSALAHVQNSNVTFELVLNNNITWRAFNACVPQHFTSIEDATSRGLFVPHNPVPHALYFDKRVGAYFIFASLKRPEVSDTTSVTLDSPSMQGEANMLTLRDSCPNDARPLVADMLSTIQNALKQTESNKPITATSPYFLLAAHNGSPTGWLSIKFVDPTSEITLQLCAHVSSATPADLKRFGIEAVRDTINVARGIGLYLAP